MTEPVAAADRRSRLGIVGIVALVGSAMIGFNSLVTSCAAENVTRNAARLHAIEEEERFWTAAMQELSNIVKDRAPKDKAPDNSNFEARCALLARRTAPFAATVETSNAVAPDRVAMQTDEIAILAQRVQYLQEEFEGLITNTKFVSENCARDFAERKDRKLTDLARAERATMGRAESPRDVPADIAVPRPPMVALSPLSRWGIDTDVFWCEDPNETASRENFADAMKIGETLAELARKGEKIAPTDGSSPFEMGRVRVRILPQLLWTKDRLYAGVDGLNVVRGGKDEGPIVGAFIGKSPPDINLTASSAFAEGTRWYVSIFTCSHNTIDPDADVASEAAGLSAVAI